MDYSTIFSEISKAGIAVVMFVIVAAAIGVYLWFKAREDQKKRKDRQEMMDKLLPLAERFLNNQDTQTQAMKDQSAAMIRQSCSIEALITNLKDQRSATHEQSVMMISNTQMIFEEMRKVSDQMNEMKSQVAALDAIRAQLVKLEEKKKQEKD